MTFKLRMKSTTTIACGLLFTLMLAFLEPYALGQRKSVHVRGYTRKDGTVVRPYDRAAPGTKSKPSASAPRSSTVGTSSSTTSKTKRSASAKAAFKKANPCPATWKTSGSCPGYVVDHIRPLACGGADAPENMQWQTAAAAKEKDKWERNGCH